MSKLMTASLLACFVACSGGDDKTPSTSAPINLFVGPWSCSRQTSYAFATPPELADLGTIDDVEGSTLNVTAEGIQLTVHEETESGDICEMSFISDGSTANVAADQSCTQATLTLKYKSGTAKVGAYEMTFNFAFEAEGPISARGTIVTAVAVGTQIASCSRLAKDGGSAGGGAW
jgi:hypothetical protein